MKINRQNLLNVLQGMQSNTSKIETNQVNFKGKIIYQTNNDIMIYSEFFEESLKENFSLPLNDLILLLSKLKDNEIELLIEDSIKIITAKTEIELPKQEIKYEFDFNNTFEWLDLPDNFIKGIKFTSAILDESSRFNPTIFIDNDKIVSTDGKCLIIYNLQKDFLKFFLKQVQINLLLKYDIKQYCIKDNLIYFKSDNTIIYFTFITESAFPPYQKIEIQNGKEIQFLDKLNIEDININTSILDNTENVKLIIEIEKNDIKISSSNYVGINVKTKLDKENEVENIKFGMNYTYLLDFLKSDFSSEFKTFISDTMIVFQNDDIKYITMLMGE